MVLLFVFLKRGLFFEIVILIMIVCRSMMLSM